MDAISSVVDGHIGLLATAMPGLAVILVSCDAGERHILSCKVKCIYSSQGCSWEGELRFMEEHAVKCSSELVSCPYAAVGCNKRLFKKQLEEHKLSIDHLEMAVKKIALLTEELKPKDKVCLPPVVFKMEEFEFHQDNDLEWDSPPFYTHPRGYKLYLKVYANGAGQYENTHLSIFVCLMHGENDDDLVWPFRGVVSFEVLNPNSDTDHKEGKARFLQMKRSEKNRKVSAAQGKSGVGWGVANLLPIFNDSDSFDSDDMNSVDDYVSDDCLHVRVSQVTVSDHNKPWLI